MTEYWKSQARKYCEFCKCWFADNKVSISFHENGKKHKESVSKHISTLSKKSAKDAKKQEKIDDEMKKMEAAAMAAYLKDVENNADLTSKCINDMLSGGSRNKNEPITKTTKKTPIWHEMSAEAGSYYWNTETNERTWDPPDEYLSLPQQEEQKAKEEEAERRKKEKEEAAEKKKKEKLKKKKDKELFKEANACVSREVKKHEVAIAGPQPRARPYGSWTAVNTEPEQHIDLQLPKSKAATPPPDIVPESEVELVTLKEEKIEPEIVEPVAFKRRKLNHGRNMRQKTGDD